MALHGGCLCGGLRYEINGKLENAGNCHCSMCRKNTGSAFLPCAQVAAKDFKWTKGEELLGSYESSPAARRRKNRMAHDQPAHDGPQVALCVQLNGAALRRAGEV